MNNSEKNIRIVKNTIVLYIRMIFLMLISLYTSRIILNALGVENYGIYNAVGGFVSMFSILSASLSSSISRFITYELGKNEKERLKIMFSIAITIQIIIAIGIILIMETAGLWFLNHKMNIPDGRIIAANWVYQFSIIAFIINLISVPYNAEIIAHEKMSAFAYISIFEAISKLGISFLILISPMDILIFYALLLLVVSIIIRLLYGWYCNRHFEECKKYRPVFDKTIFKQMFSFAGWNFFGNTAYIFNTQGVNILMNIFFGVSVNAARGVAVQVDTAINQCVNNFTTAINPQITKSYATGEHEYMHQLIRRGTKFTYFLMLFFAIPIILEADIILHIWLKTVPVHAISFMRLAIISSMITMLGNSLLTAIFATGNIKRYEIIVTAIGFCVFPLSYVAFKLNMPPESAYYIYIFIYLILIFVRIYLSKDLIHLDIRLFLKKVIMIILIVTITSLTIPFIIHTTTEQSIIRFLSVGITSVISTACSVYFIGMDYNERKFISSKIINIIRTKLWH